MTLGLAEEDMTDVAGRSFAQLGGDSLAAIQFARYVGELCGVNLPVSFVLDHSHSLQAITDRVNELVRCSSVLLDGPLQLFFPPCPSNSVVCRLRVIPFLCSCNRRLPRAFWDMGTLPSSRRRLIDIQYVSGPAAAMPVRGLPSSRFTATTA